MTLPAYQFIGSNDEATVETLLAAKEQAEQTAAGLQARLDSLTTTLESIVTVSTDALVETMARAALHGQAGTGGKS